MQLEDFLKNQSYFALGHLPTEQSHPETLDLSNQVKTNLPLAIKNIQKIDVHALQVARDAFPLIEELERAIQNTFGKGGRVFLSGCGATGRLALTLESLYRRIHTGTDQVDQVHALMAGGDFALVKSVENFEDFPEYGSRHLLDRGFQEGDLLIAITEGGETPYVIGTVDGALAHSSIDPWFVYCNPSELLVKTVPRSKAVIENPRVKSLCLDTGPMALSGSTRLQAASVQMLAVGAALLGRLDTIEKTLTEYAALDLVPFLTPVIEWETSHYQNYEVVLYETDAYPIAVLTDTTERSPTFSLTPFEKPNGETSAYSLCYLSVPAAMTAEEAWLRILLREPVGLDWPEFQGRFDEASILEFDFSRNAKQARAERIVPKTQVSLTLRHEHDHLIFQTDAFTSRLKTPLVLDPLCEQLLIKMVLNTLSLMVMGKLNRYEGNVMTWVRASNGKLVDRTLRYLEQLIKKRGLHKRTRAQLIEDVFQVKDKLGPSEALILKLLNQYRPNP